MSLCLLGKNQAKLTRCDGSDGKTKDSGLKCPGFNHGPRQEKYFLLFTVGCFGQPPSLFTILLQILVILNNQGNKEEVNFFP